jgi:hypothetical protein
MMLSLLGLGLSSLESLHSNTAGQERFGLTFDATEYLKQLPACQYRWQYSTLCG